MLLCQLDCFLAAAKLCCCCQPLTPLLLLLLQDVAPPLDEISRFNQAGQSGEVEDLTVRTQAMHSTLLLLLLLLL